MMAPRFPDEVNVFAVPHSRMKALVDTYMEQLSNTDFCSNGSLESLLQHLQTTFCEFKTHEYIENQFIMERLKERLRSVNVSSQAVCNCHRDNQLTEVVSLIRNGYSCTAKSSAERLNFARTLQDAVSGFTATFLPHMQEEEEVFQPLLMKYFAYDELRHLKKTVIEQHELWKEKLFSEKENVEHVFAILSSFAEEVADYCSSENDDNLSDALQQLVELTCENLGRELGFFTSEKSSHCTTTFDSLPDEMLLHVFSFLDPPDRGRCAQVSRRWSSIVYTPSLWREIYPASWAKGFWKFQYRDPYDDVEAYLSKHRRGTSEEYDEDADIDECEDATEKSDRIREMRLYESLLQYVLPKIGPGVRRLDVAGGFEMTSRILRAMLILCPNVEHLDASYTPVTDSAFKGLALKGCCASLTHLDLTGCSAVCDTGLQRLGDCFVSPDVPNICGRRCSDCAIEGCPRKPVPPRTAFSSPGLRYLSLSGCHLVTGHGLRALLDVTLRARSLEYMDLSGCMNLSASALQYVARFAPTLRPDNLFYCNLIEGGPYPTEANGCQNLACPTSPGSREPLEEMPRKIKRKSSKDLDVSKTADSRETLM